MVKFVQGQPDFATGIFGKVGPYERDINIAALTVVAFCPGTINDHLLYFGITLKNRMKHPDSIVTQAKLHSSDFIFLVELLKQRKVYIYNSVVFCQQNILQTKYAQFCFDSQSCPSIHLPVRSVLY